jgi:hypothetical protein
MQLRVEAAGQGEQDAGDESGKAEPVPVGISEK